jgi:hypothetical protein
MKGMVIIMSNGGISLKPLKNFIVFLLAAVLLWSLLPAAAAVDGEAVLTFLKHKNTDMVPVSDPAIPIVLTVAASFADASVDLSNDLTIGYDTALYKNVVAAPEGPALVDGPPVTMNVSFNNISDEDGAEKSHTAYTVIVVRAAAVAPTFSGTLVKETTAPGGVTFLAADFTSKYTRNDGEALGYISLSGSNPTFGAIKLSGAAYTFGTRVSIASIGQLTFAAAATGTVSYDVEAYAGTDTVNPIGNVVLTVTAYSVPSIKTPIADSVTKGMVLPFTAAYFTSHCDMSGVPLVSIELTPTNTAYGSWALGATPFTGSKTIAASDLDGLTFTATAPGAATFNWRVANKAGFSATGSGVLTVTSPTLTLTPFSAPVPILKGGAHTVTPADFVFSPPAASLSYIKITAVPASVDGHIYLTVSLPKNDAYGYPALASNMALPANAVIPASYLGLLRIATKTTSPNSQITFKWTATADLKVTSANWGEQTTYTVGFVAGGALSYSTDMNVPLALSASDISGQFQTLTHLPLSYVTFVLPDKNAGTLYYNYDLITMKGTAVTAATKYYAGKSPNLAGITFVPVKDYTGSVTVTYNAFAENGSTISGTIAVAVANSPGGTLSLQTDKNSPLQFDAGAFQSAFLAATGKSLSSVSFTLPLAASGTLVYNCDVLGQGGTAVTSGSVYYTVSSPYLSLVSFMPAKDFTGAVPITYRGYTSSGAMYTGKVIISVIDSAAGIVTYSVSENGTVALSGQDFSDEFVGVTGSLLSYVSFTAPPATSGMLYEQYDPVKRTGKSVSASTKYYNGKSPDISGLTFVPAKDFTGTVIVAYKAYNAAGQSFAGKLKFIVSQSTQTISYEVASGSFVTMDAGDFKSDFNLLSGGSALSAVAFTLPSPSYGKLYYNYKSPTSFDAAVTAATRYALGAEPLLSGVSFVPAAGYSGSFTFTYTGYAADGVSYTGKIHITVSGAASGGVKYTTSSTTPVTFKAADFVAAYKAGGTLSYVVFSPLPYPSYGILYSGYTAASSPGVAVTTASKFYASGTPSISGVTFVPKSGYTGTVAMTYTAYNAAGTSSSGTVLVTVMGGELGNVVYTALDGKPVLFSGEDFNAVFQKKTGQTLSYVVFAPPSPSEGTLYLGYTSPALFTAVVTADAKYYRSYAPLLSNVSFVPRVGLTGSVTIAYTGYSAGGTAYSGKILVNIVTAPPFPDMKSGFDWAAPAVSYLYSKGIVKGAGDGNFHPTDNVTRGDFILMVTRAFNLTSYSTDNFPDVPLGVYYYSAVATAKYFGIVTGSDGKFNPTANLSRQDAMVILSRTLSHKGLSLAQGTAGDLSSFSDASQVSDYAVTAMASLVKSGVLTGSGGNLNPKSMITRAEMAVILYRVLTL